MNRQFKHSTSPGQSQAGEIKVIHQEILGTRANKQNGKTEQVVLQVSGNGSGAPWIRIAHWWENDQGEWCPGKVGVTIKAAEFADVLKAIELAQAVAPEAKPVQRPAPKPPAPKKANGNWKRIQASKYSGRCCECGGSYEEGDVVGFNPDAVAGKKGAHWDCVSGDGNSLSVPGFGQLSIDDMGDEEGSGF